jgi:hypothetical protein
VCKICFPKSFIPLLRSTHVPYLGRWIICTESTKNSYKIQKKITNTKDINCEQNSRPIYPWQGIQTKSSSIPAPSVCAHLKHFAHHIQSSPLWSSEKRPVQNKQSASCISSYVESSAKGTARSVSESYGVSDGVGSQQTLLFCLLEGPRRAFNVSWLILDFVACLIFFFWVASSNLLWIHYFLCFSTMRTWL